MKAVALESTSDSAPARKGLPAWIPSVPVSPWFVQPISASASVLQRKSSCACGGGCPRCQQETNPETVQTKLPVSTPGDEYEREADRVADQVMRMPAAGGLSDVGSAEAQVQRKCAQCDEDDVQKPQEEEPKVMRAAAGSSLATVSRNVLPSGGGQPLSKATRDFFEPKFGVDFSGVRIHTDARANEAARSINAVAYSCGKNVVFEAGRYDPDSAAGRHLLAHELTHVVQQNGGAPSSHLEVQRLASPMLQRQKATCAIDIIEIAKLLAGDDEATALKVLNCCGEGLGPLPAGCTADLVDLARKVLGKKGKKGPQQANCRGLLGFRPGTSREFIGQCCRGEVKEDPPRPTVVTGTESKENCCLPDRISAKDFVPRCCSDDEIVQDGHCTKKPATEVPTCPPGQTKTIMGTCAPTKQPDTPPDKPPDKPPAPFTTVSKIVIEFNKDAPQSWSSFKSSVTVDGQKHFDELVATLTAQPDTNVQLEAHASSEKPAKDEGYNKRLTDRRVKIVVAELKKNKIAAQRVSDPPTQANPSDCAEIATGQLSCGDVGSNATADAGDRKVVAQIFSVTK